VGVGVGRAGQERPGEALRLRLVMADGWDRYRELLASGRFEKALVEAKRVGPEVVEGFDRDAYVEHMVRNHVEEEQRKRRAP